LFFKRFSVARTYIKRIKCDSVLDLGCGDGIFTNQLKHKCKIPRVVGVDLNIHTEDLNKRYGKIEFIKGDILKLGYKQEFDIVTGLDVLEHFIDVGHALWYIKNYIKKDGHLIISGPTETLFYKIGRFLIKGKDGPGPGTHYHDVVGLDKSIQKNGFLLIQKVKIRFLFFELFSVNLYKKVGGIK